MLKTLLLLLCGHMLALCAGHAAPAHKPNVLVILTDDQGWGDLSLNGNTNLSTPRIDALARQGVVFDRFYVSPVCAPTRAEFLTGRYHLRTGVHGVSTGAERLNLGEQTLAEAFKAAGYRTGAFGKWHNGTQYPYHPNGRGFDEFYGFCSGHWGTYFNPPLEHNGEPVKGNGYIIDDITGKAMGFMEQNRNGPFFCYVPFNSPHSPMQVPDSFYEKFKDKPLGMRATKPGQEDTDHTRAALAMCENIDRNVGRLLDHVKALGLEERTIVVYFSDNGPNGWRWNGGMKGRKGTTDEGGVRVPMIMRWPGQIPAGRTIPQITAAIDLFPTLAGLAGVPIPSGKPMDGLSLQPLLLGAETKWTDRIIFSHWNGRVSARSQQYRLDSEGQLYDMAADPGQARNVASAEPVVLQKMTQAVREWKKDANFPAQAEQRPYTVGYPEFPRTILPARDGIAHGSIQRSANAPNCSFFENWTTAADRITWDVEVGTAGNYEVEVLHTCPKESVGAEVELSLGQARVRAKLSEPHDPPLTGAEHDRVPRKGESFVKDFKPLPMGSIKLSQGRGLLTLKAVSVPAGKVMDVRAVLLTLRK